MIVVTGGAGFIGQNLVNKLIELGYEDIVVVDNNNNRLIEKYFKVKYISVENSYLWLGFNKYNIDVVYHLGARTDTMEKDEKIFELLNLNYSKFIWNLCIDGDIPLIYASSVATYGDGEDGFYDEDSISRLRPLNFYGWSKQLFDLFVIGSSIGDKKYCVNGLKNTPPFWVGLKFFSVYGNHEEHKGAMASVIWHFYNQIKETGEVKLFRSHVDFCKDGEQKRDFIHVDDVVSAMIWMYRFRNDVPSDIYNLGTGTARTYNDVARAIFKCLDKPVEISYIDTPVEIRDSYQYYTNAKMGKFQLGSAGWIFKTLEEGIEIYMNQLLKNENS